jgi:hypothetical protein
MRDNAAIVALVARSTAALSAMSSACVNVCASSDFALRASASTSRSHNAMRAPLCARRSATA